MTTRTWRCKGCKQTFQHTFDEHLAHLQSCDLAQAAYEYTILRDLGGLREGREAEG